VITIDPTKGERYQGIVPLVSNSLAHSLDAYFQMSEQLHTRFWLACDGTLAAGMLLQQLPSQLQPNPQDRENQWQHTCILADTIQDEELLALPAEQSLQRLFHEDPIRLFEARRPEFCCSCSRERTFNALSAIGSEEVTSLLEEQGSITMDCEFCNQQYVFQPQDLTALLPSDSPPLTH
ncbi:MAG: Hsp33 family molecular chaperone HslO, partial [Halieaceae bacterium]